MTAYGLFVSIPALLAYNAFVRVNRNLIGDLERFAYTVFGLLGLGSLAGSAASGEPQTIERPTVAARTDAVKAKAEAKAERVC